jgi:hypothetical protein
MVTGHLIASESDTPRAGEGLEAQPGRQCGRYLDLTGHRYGRLAVIALAEERSGGGFLKWRCLCDCGRESTARAKDLRLGTTTSCGCAKAESGRKRTGKPDRGLGVRPGMKFGRLTVKFLSLSDGNRYFWCDCECGGGSNVRANLLTSGQTKSCGCLRGLPKADPIRARLKEAA